MLSRMSADGVCRVLHPRPLLAGMWKGQRYQVHVVQTCSALMQSTMLCRMFGVHIVISTSVTAISTMHMYGNMLQGLLRSALAVHRMQMQFHLL